MWNTHSTYTIYSRHLFWGYVNLTATLALVPWETLSTPRVGAFVCRGKKLCLGGYVREMQLCLEQVPWTEQRPLGWQWEMGDSVCVPGAPLPLDSKLGEAFWWQNTHVLALANALQAWRIPRQTGQASCWSLSCKGKPHSWGQGRMADYVFAMLVLIHIVVRTLSKAKQQTRTQLNQVNGTVYLKSALHR